MNTNFIVNPNHFKLPAVQKNLILFFSLNHFYSYREICGITKVKNFGPLKKFDIPDLDTTVLGGCIGAPYAVLMLENAIHSGARKVITFGSCGYFGDQKLTYGTLASSKVAYDETGISAEITDQNDPMSIIPLSETYQASGIVSINNLFAVSPERINQWKSKEIELMDMEAAALNSVAQNRNISISNLFVISDLFLSDLTWNPGFHTSEFKEGTQKGLNLLHQLNQDFIN